MANQTTSTRQDLSEDEFYFWLGYVDHPDKWRALPMARRHAAGCMAKQGRRKTLFMVTLAATVILVLWAAVHLSNGPNNPAFDLVVGGILATLIIIALFNL